MRLEFDSLEISDFKCFTTKQTLDFASHGPGLWFMRGRNDVEPKLGANGAGKSSAFDALCWCIYGRTPSGLKNPDVRPWAGRGTPTISLLIELDGNPHEIARTAVTNGLKIDGQEVGSEEAEKLIGLSFDVFTNTVLLAQGQPLFLDRSPKDKMQLFADVLNLERWEDRSAGASAKARELEQLAAELTGEETGLNAALAQAGELLAKAKASSATWEAERRERVAKAAQTLKEQEAVLARQRSKLGEADLAWDGAATEFKALKKEILVLAEAVAGHKETYSGASYALDTKKTEARKIEREIATLGEAEECPTCGQSLKGTGLAKHQADLKAQLKALQTVIAAGIPQKLTLTKEKAEDALERASAAAEGFEDKADKARAELDFLKPQVAELAAQVLALKSGRTEQEEASNPYQEQVQTLRRKSQQTEVKLTELREDLAKAGRQLERTKFWVKGFKDLKLYLIQEVLQELELTTNAALTEVGLDDWSIKFDVERETKSGGTQRGINAVILSPSNKEAVRFENWSGGEGQRLRIVGALALSQVLLNHAGVETSFECLDEPTRHLSAEGVRDLCEYLSDRAQRLNKQSWLVDHMARAGNAISGSVTVVKTTKGAHFE
jgi:DNA repair exonuclease SbcCD ATPase subunit